MKRKWWWLFFFLLLVVGLYLWREILLLKVLESFLAREEISFSCRDFSLKRGRLEFKELRIIQPQSFDLFIQRALAEISLFSRKIALDLYGLKGIYFLSPSSGEETIVLPTFLDRVSVHKADLNLRGKSNWRWQVDELSARGLQGLWYALAKGPKPAQRQNSSSREEKKSQPQSTPSPDKDLSQPVKIDVRIDLRALPLNLPSGFQVAQGYLLLSLGAAWEEENFPLQGRFFLKDLRLLGPEKKELHWSGEGQFKGYYGQKNKLFSFSGLGHFEQGLRFSFSLQGKENKLEKLALSFEINEPFWKQISPFLESSISARIKGKLEGSLDPLRLRYQVVLEQGAFEISPEQIGQGIELEAQGKIWEAQGLSFQGAWRLSKGEFYIHPWYYNLEEPIDLNFEGSWRKKSLWLQKLRVEGPFQLEAKGLKLYPEPDLPTSGQLQVKVDKFWKPLVQEPFSEAHPSLNKIHPSGDLLLKKEGPLCTLRFQGQSLVYEHTIQGLSLEGGYDLSGQKCPPFRLSWSQVQGKFLSLGALDLRGKTCKQEIFSFPFRFQALGGFISCGEGWGRWGKEKRFRLHQLLAKDLKPALPPPYHKLSPRIDAYFQEVVYAQGRLWAKGKMVISLARGRLEVRDIFFEPGILPRYGGEVEIKGLDLALLTEVTGFGLITGRLNGRIKNLVMSGVLPEKFELWLEDDPQYRGPRRISLEAIRNISELGGNPASGFFIPFAKNLRYQRLGLYCRLENDRFYLRGLIREGGREYLVKGPKLFGVDVINQNPKGSISFKEMVRRLKSILGGSHEKKDLS